MTLPEEKRKEICENSAESSGEAVETDAESCSFEKHDPPNKGKCSGDAPNMQLDDYTTTEFKEAHDEVKGKCMPKCDKERPNEVTIEVEYKDTTKAKGEMKFCTKKGNPNIYIYIYR